MNTEENIGITEQKENDSELISSLGTIISVVNLYGLNHMISIDAIEKSFELLKKSLSSRKRISFNVVDNQLLIDMAPLNKSGNFIARFIERLAILEIGGFTFANGISEDEFIQFIILLTSRDTAFGGDDFTKALVDGGMEHVSASKAVLREVLDDEIVIRKDEVGSGGGSGEGGYNEETVQQVVAFLKGDIETAPPDSIQNIEPTETNINQLSELILNSVSITQRNPNLATGETVGDILVGCLRRTFNTQLKSTHTKTGRKKISKSLLMMEKSILDKLRDFADGDQEELEEQVTTTLADMRDELKIDGIVSDYLKKQKSLDVSEHQLVKLLKNKDADWVKESGLQEKILDGGIADGEWRKLVVQADVNGLSGTGIVSGGNSAGDLEHVLSDLAKALDDFSSDKGDVKAQQKVTDSLTLVGEEIETVVSQANEKIDTLAAELESSVKNNKAPTIHEWALVQEILQELCQPLSVVSCTIEMLVGGHFGAVPEASKIALELAAESSIRMRSIADKLIDVCGVPASLLPGG